MKNLRELLLGLFTAMVSIVIVLGAISLSMAEDRVVVIEDTPVPAASQETPQPSATAQTQEETPAAEKATKTAKPTATSPIASPTVSGSETCKPPQGWTSYTIQAGDSLDSLAAAYQTTKAEIKEANCLVSDTLLPNTILYLPPAKPTATLTPKPTSTAIQCSAPPAGWTTYIVQRGDTLTSLSYRYQVSVRDLQKYNCLGNSYAIQVGQALFVPYRPPIYPTQPTVWPPYPTATWRPQPSATPFPSPTMDSNRAPLDLTISNDSIAENGLPGAVIGTFTTADPDPTDSHTLALLNADGGSFAISGNNLVATAPMNYEARSLYTITVRTTDRGGKSIDRNFWITVTNVNEAPTSMSISGTSVASGSPAGTVVGVLLTSDVDNGDSHTYTLFGGQTASFTLQDNVLVTNVVLDAAVQSSYNIIIRTTDREGLSFDQQYYITVLPAP